MISSRMTSGRSLMRSTGDSTGSSDPGGGKQDDLLKDDVREIADAIHWRFYRFLRSGWGEAR